MSTEQTSIRNCIAEGGTNGKDLNSIFSRLKKQHGWTAKKLLNQHLQQMITKGTISREMVDGYPWFKTVHPRQVVQQPQLESPACGTLEMCVLDCISEGGKDGKSLKSIFDHCKKEHSLETKQPLNQLFQKMTRNGTISRVIVNSYPCFINVRPTKQPNQQRQNQLKPQTPAPAPLPTGKSTSTPQPAPAPAPVRKETVSQSDESTVISRSRQHEYQHHDQQQQQQHLHDHQHYHHHHHHHHTEYNQDIDKTPLLTPTTVECTPKSQKKKINVAGFASTVFGKRHADIRTSIGDEVDQLRRLDVGTFEAPLREIVSTLEYSDEIYTKIAILIEKKVPNLIVQFCGHCENGNLIYKDTRNYAKGVPAEELGPRLAECEARCLVLNVCTGEELAKIIQTTYQQRGYVQPDIIVYWKTKVNTDVCIQFNDAFYKCLLQSGFCEEIGFCEAYNKAKDMLENNGSLEKNELCCIVREHPEEASPSRPSQESKKIQRKLEMETKDSSKEGGEIAKEAEDDCVL